MSFDKYDQETKEVKISTRRTSPRRLSKRRQEAREDAHERRKSDSRRASIRRAHKRVIVSFPVICKDSQENKKLYSANISEGGILLQTDTEMNIDPNSSLIFSFPEITLPSTIQIKPVRTKNNNNIHSFAFKFEEYKNLKNNIKQFFKHIKFPRPELTIRHEPRFCHLYGIDLSLGCDSGCLYCHFCDGLKKEHNYKEEKIIKVDLTSLYGINSFPNTIFLSPASDPFAPNVREMSHELLKYALPQGAIFLILTKHIIPDKTINLLAKYKNQIECIGIGLSSLDDNRNAVLEPGCPPSKDRMKLIKKVVETGIETELRADPIFPVIDDSAEALEKIIKVASDLKVSFFSATYIFTWGRYLKKIRKIYGESASLITDKTEMMGGKGFSVDTEYKKNKYNLMNEICKKNNVMFNTCGCKNIKLKKEGFALICRNLKFYKKKENSN